MTDQPDKHDPPTQEEDDAQDQTQAFDADDAPDTFGLDSFDALQTNPGVARGRPQSGESTSLPEEDAQPTMPASPAEAATLQDLDSAKSPVPDGDETSDDEAARRPRDVLSGDDIGDLPTEPMQATPTEDPATSLDQLIEVGLLQTATEEQMQQGASAVLVGRYLIFRQLGEGGMGVVFEARDTQTDEEVAVKLVRATFAGDAEVRQQFVDEAVQMSKLEESACVLGVKAIGTAERPYYIMPYMRGGSLARLLRRERGLERNRILELAVNIATAIDHVHVKLGRIHRDIKPQNILLAEDGSARLCDFGLVFEVGQGVAGIRAGTLAYMPPEVITKDNRNIGFEWDIYSFGAMLYEMLAGKRPYDELCTRKTSVASRVRKLREEMVKRPPEPIRKINRKADADLAQIADWAMSREVRDRYVSMSDVLADLQRVHRGRKPLGPRQRRGVGLVMTVCVLVALFASGAFVWPKLFGPDPVEVERIVAKPNVVVDPPLGLRTTEAGGVASFTVRLDSKPSAPVRIPVRSTRPNEGRTDVSSLSFNADNWDVPRTVVVTGNDDRVQDGSVEYAITLGPAESEDEKYAGFKIDPVSATNSDDDQAGIDVRIATDLATSESGDHVPLEVSLTSQPTAAVTVPIHVSDNSEAKAIPPTVTFTPQKWQTPVTVRIVGQDDAAQDGPVPYELTVGAAVSEDSVYRGLSAGPYRLENRDTTPRNVKTSTGNGIVDGQNAKRPIDVRVTTVPEGKQKFGSNDPIQFHVTADQPGHVLLMLVSLDDPNPVVTVVYPNVEQKVQLLEVGGRIVAPTKAVIAQPPTGRVLVKVIMTPKPVPLASPGNQSIEGGMFRLGLKGMGTENDADFELVKDLNAIFAADTWSTAELVIEITDDEGAAKKNR